VIKNFFLKFKTFILISPNKFFFGKKKKKWFICCSFLAANYKQFMIRYRRIIHQISTWHLIQNTWDDYCMINIWWKSTSSSWNRWTINWKNKTSYQGYCWLIYLVNQRCSC
jgi:hypothetical protein